MPTAEDPLGWLEIDAYLRSQQKGGPTGYDPGTNVDPQWDAYRAGYDYRRTQAQADTKLRKERAKLGYDDALSALEQRGLTGRRNLDTNMLARGVYRSGETGRRRDELGKALTLAREEQDRSYANQVGDIDADQQRALTELDLDRESQIAASRARVSAAEMLARQAANAATPGLVSVPSLPAPTVPRSTAPAAPQRQAPMPTSRGADDDRAPSGGTGVTPPPPVVSAPSAPTATTPTATRRPGGSARKVYQT